MDYEVAYWARMPEWMSREAKPPRPDIFLVQVPKHDPVTNEFIRIDEHYAKWTGEWWCAWAIDVRRAAMCDMALGPLGGYSWRNPHNLRGGRID